MLLEVDEISLNYARQGSGPDVLLLPGLGANVYAWHAQLQGLCSVLRLTALDPRGHGRSGCPEGPYTIPQLAEDAASVVRSLEIGPAVVVGSSMSTLTGVALAAAHPDLVAALVLVGGFARMPPAGRERMLQRVTIAETEGMEPLAPLVASTALGVTTHATQPGLVGLFQHMIASNNPRGYAESARAVAGADVTSLLSQVRCPTLVLLGAEEQVAPLPAARALKAGIADAEVRVLPGCGHLPFLEQPALFNAALLQFVAEKLGTG